MQKEKSVDNKPTMDHRNPRSTASIHPAPGQSPLWEHWPLIKGMRKARKTWEEIASAVEQASEKKLKVAASTVCNFYRRIEKRQKEGKRPMPIGYEDSGPTAGPTYSAQAGPAQPTGEPSDPADTPEVRERPTADQLARVAKKPRHNPLA